MVIILYGFEGSPPVRAVLFTLHALGLEFKFKKVNILQRENLSEAFLKKNPMHTVPVLEDDGPPLVDSHAISSYLVRKYGKDDTLYPKDFKLRSVVDQRLHFDSGVLFPNLASITGSLVRHEETEVPQSKIDTIIEGYELLEAFLQHNYIAGENMTIADFSILTTVSSLEIFAPIDAKKFPKLAAWRELMWKVPYYERANEMGLALFNKMVYGLLNKN